MTPILFLGLITALGAAVRGNWSPCGESLQAQIHPLGERSRGNIWGVTMTAFTLGSILAGAALTSFLGLLGGGLIDFGDSALWVAGTLAVAAGLLDLSPLKPWTPRRQVNENWIGRYRGWVYGAGFGLQLGLGFAVFVMSWGYWAMLAIAFISGSAVVGALLGATFGLGRGLLLLLSRRSTTLERLSSFHQSMMRYKVTVFRMTGAVTAAAGLLILL
jgi:MFS family permease